MRLATEVTEDDVLQASMLIRIATQQAATDPNTGLVDMGLINTGVSHEKRQRLIEL